MAKVVKVNFEGSERGRLSNDDDNLSDEQLNQENEEGLDELEIEGAPQQELTVNELDTRIARLQNALDSGHIENPYDRSRTQTDIEELQRKKRKLIAEDGKSDSAA